MSLKDTLQKTLTPELFETITDALGDDFNYDLVPRARLNKVIKQRDEARNATGGKQPPKVITKSKKHADDDDDDDDEEFDIEAFKQQLKDENAELQKQVRIQYAALNKLREADVIDPEMVWSSNAIDKTKLSIDDANNLVGLDDIITQLKKDKGHLFKDSQPTVPNGTGKNGGDEFKNVTSIDEFLKLSSDKQLEFKKAQPEVFKTFLSNK